MVAWTVFDPWPQILGYVRAHERAFAAAAAVAVAVGAGLASCFGRRLQVLCESGQEQDPSESAWTYNAVATPAGTAIGWAVLYGAGYLALAAFLVADPYGWTQDVWGRASLLTATVLGAVLVLVLPWSLPLREVRSIERTTLERYRVAPLATAVSDQRQQIGTWEETLARDLVRHGISYRWLVLPPLTNTIAPRLSSRGTRLANKMISRRAAQTQRGTELEQSTLHPVPDPGTPR